MQGDASTSLSAADDNYMRAKVKFKEELMLQQLKKLEALFHDEFSAVKKPST
ncbi:MAG: hypothetical protein U5L96_00470 [Owenweeksia sp.]|nr:hypothetical protein [Owenweeksia sp.]